MSKEKMCEQCKNCICKSCVQVAWLQDMLKEIKEISNKTLWTYSNLDDVTKYNMFDKILQKINEVV